MKVIERPATGRLAEMIAALPFKLDFEKGPWVAGGAVRRFMCDESFEGADVDVFCSSLLESSRCALALDQADFGLALHTDWSQFWKRGDLKVNLVDSKVYESAEKLIASFDFTICQFVTDGVNVGYAAEPAPFEFDSALIDASGKNLRFLETDSVSATIRRALKYAKQGFMAGDAEIGAFLKRHVGTPAMENVRASQS